MSKKLITVFLFFAVTIFTLIYAYLAYTRPTESVNIISKKYPIKIQPEASLSLVPGVISTAFENTSTADVIIETNTTPTLIQLEISYDPTMLFNVKISPGSYFINSEVVLEKIDSKNGRVSYVLQGKSLNTGENTIATINFTTPYLLTQTETYLTFLPKTSIKIIENSIKIKSMEGAKIIIQPPSLVPIATPSGILL